MGRQSGTRRGTRRGTRHGASSGDPHDSDSSDSDHSHGSDDNRRHHFGGILSGRRRHHRRHRHADGGFDEAQLRDESEWVLTGLGIVLYFFGWFSIVALFVVIVAF